MEFHDLDLNFDYLTLTIARFLICRMEILIITIIYCVFSRGATPLPRSSSCAGPGGPRGATPHSRSGGVTSSKVRSSHEEITHVQGKRKPSKMVGVVRRHQRANTLKP